MAEKELLVVDHQTKSGLHVARKPLSIVKIGGSEVDRASDAIAGVYEEGHHDLVIVHGAGGQISDRMRKKQLEPRFDDEGNRVSDSATRDVVIKVLDEVNEGFANALTKNGVPVIEYHSKAGLIQGEAVSPENLVARTGSLRVDGLRLESDLYEEGNWPVIAPLAASVRNGALNVNADTAAVAVAQAMGGKDGGANIIFITGTGGVLSGGNTLKKLSGVQLGSIEITGGMRRKAAEAVRAGGATIVDLSNLSNALNGARVGTRVSA